MQGSDKGIGSSARFDWAVALALALGCALLVHGWAFRIAGPVSVGNWVHPDNLSNHWLLVWVAERLLSGGDLLHNDSYYWPVGDAPLLAGNGMAGFTYLPFHLLLGWPAAALAWSIAAVTWSGFAAWWLARAAGARGGGAWIAATAVGCHPYLVSELDMGHFSQVDLGWWLAALAALVTLLRGGPAWWGAVCGVFAAAAALLYWYHGVFFALTAAALIPGLILASPERRIPWGGLALAVAVGAILVLPWGVVSLSTLDQVVGMGEISQFPHPHAVDASMHLGWPWRVGGAWQWGRAWPVLLIPLSLAGLGRRTWPWGIAWGLGFALALGPSGPLYEPIYGLAAPLRRFWWPYRHEVMTLTSGATLAALGWRARWPRWAALALALSVPLQLQLSGDLRLVKLSPLVAPPPVYSALAALPDGVVLEPPLAPGASASTTMVLYQIWHHKPLVGGQAQWVGRVRPAAWDAAVAQSPFLSGLTAWELGAGAGTLPTDDLPALLGRGLRYLVINPEHFHRRMGRTVRGYQAIARRLCGVPVLRGGAIEVFDLSGYHQGATIALPENPWPRGLPRSGPEQPFPGKLIPSEIFGEDSRGPPH